MTDPVNLVLQFLEENMTEPKAPKPKSPDDLPDILPIMPLFDAALFPKMVLPLAVMQEESIQLIDEAMSTNRIIGLAVATNRTDKSPYPKEDLAKIGTTALILKMAKTEDQKAQLLVQGLSRFKVTAFQNGHPYLMAQVEHLTDAETKDNETDAVVLAAQ